MNSKITKLLLIIVAIIILFTIVGLIMLKNNEKDHKIDDYFEADKLIIKKEENIYLIKNEDLYFTIKDIMQNYIKSIENKDIATINNLLSQNYIKSNNITNENILDVLPKYFIPVFIPEHMYEKEGDINDTVYIDAIIQNSKVEGLKLNIIQNEECFKILFSKNNLTYAIEPITKQEYETAITGKTREDTFEIKENSNNKVKNIIAKEINIVSEYLYNYTNKLRYNPEKAYDLLDDEYKQKRYPDYNKFKGYISNIEQTSSSILEKYEVKYDEEYNKIYICTDQYGRKYIFKCTDAVMEYSVILDDYTLENKEFIEKYQKADRQNKGIYNIDKFFKMINIKDYSSAYNVLDENFKQTYFKTEQEFIDFMKSNIYEINKVKYETYMDVTGEIVSYTTKLTDYTGEKTGEIEFDVVMKLINENEFKMSFTIKK